MMYKMREILFRAKRTDKDPIEWVYGSYCPKKTGRYKGEQFVEETKHIIIINMTGSGYTYAPVDPETVGQYTGLTDKNGRKIFEGDIINDIDYGIMKCIYLHGSFVWYKEDRFKIECMKYAPVIEVIGNIFDNPELVKG